MSVAAVIQHNVCKPTCRSVHVSGCLLGLCDSLKDVCVIVVDVCVNLFDVV